MFIGRKEEIKEIKNALNSSKLETILLYGRRRVGKSEIIKESLKNETSKIVYFECKRTTSKVILENLSKLFQYTFKLSNLSFNSFDDFFY